VSDVRNERPSLLFSHLRGKNGVEQGKGLQKKTEGLKHK
jgi:hypothetical protein